MQRADTRRDQQGRTFGRLVLPAFVAMVVPALAVAVAVVIGSAWVDRPSVANGQGLRTVEFGLPWAWLHQDQSALDPPFPYRTSFISPWDNPTTVSWWVLLADIGVVATVLAALALLGAGPVRRAISRPRRQAIARMR